MVGWSAAVVGGGGEIKTSAISAETQFAGRAVEVLDTAIVRVGHYNKRAADAIPTRGVKGAIVVGLASLGVRSQFKGCANTLEAPVSWFADGHGLAADIRVGSNVDVDANSVDTELARFAWFLGLAAVEGVHDDLDRLAFSVFTAPLPGLAGLARGAAVVGVGAGEVEGDA